MNFRARAHPFPVGRKIFEKKGKKTKILLYTAKTKCYNIKVQYKGSYALAIN